MAQQGRSRTFEKEQRALWCRWLHPSKARLLVHGLHANSSRRSDFMLFFTRVGISSMLLGCRDRPDMVNRFSVLVRFNKALRVRRWRRHRHSSSNTSDDGGVRTGQPQRTGMTTFRQTFPIDTVTFLSPIDITSSSSSSSGRGRWGSRSSRTSGGIYILHELFAHWANFFAQRGGEHHHLLSVGCVTENLLDVAPHICVEGKGRKKLGYKAVKKNLL